MLGKEYMTKFPNYLIHNTFGEGVHGELVRNKANADGRSARNSLSREKIFFDVGERKIMSPGVVIIIVHHEVLTSGKDKFSGLWISSEALMTKSIGRTLGHTYCMCDMHLTFAAGRHIGKLTGPEELKE